MASFATGLVSRATAIRSQATSAHEKGPLRAFGRTVEPSTAEVSRVLPLLLVLLLLVVLFGGLGFYVAKAFLVLALVALLASLVMGGFQFRGHRH